MADLKIHEFAEINSWGRYDAPDVDQPVIVISGASQPSAAFQFENVRFTTTVPIYVEFGAVPVATAAGSELFEAGAHDRKVTIGHKMAVLQA